MKALHRTILVGAVCALAIGAAVAPLHAQPPGVAARDSSEVDHRQANIISEGVRMSAHVFSLKSLAGETLPTIIMCHGWGGTAASLRPVAEEFARAGYLVVTFDYRGWGESDSRVILTKPAPSGRTGNRFVAEVLEVREVVDPLDQTTDLLNAIHWVQGEPQCDTQRIGLWGSSYSGGHVIYAAARDPRVKATVSQVPSLDSRWVVATEAARNLTYSEGTKRTRGVVGYPPPGARVIGGLKGAPILERMIDFAPVEDIAKASHSATLFIVAEHEELFDNKDHAGKAYERAKGSKKLVTIPDISHYGIYREARPQATRLAIEWYDEHLKD